jgi:1-acyl-sn-glycerol-3-phosphate acyltransferase
MAWMRAARSVLSLALVLLWMAVPCWPLLELGIVPLARLRPRARRGLISWYMKFVVRGILRCMRLGGARFRWSGRLPGAEPVLVLMNHQSQVDILIATMLGEPHVPAFVPRARYARHVPLVSRSIELLGCPIVDPKRDPRGATETMRRAALELDHALLVFPEGHRSLDGELRPFRVGGTLAVLEARRLPVYLVVTDGYYRARRFVDFLFNISLLDGDTEVLGPFEPPADAAALPAAVNGWREIIERRLHERRAPRAAP